MLKSTHKAKAPPAGSDPLPPGWTEHKAPSGHPYYYNTATKQSTYHRPTVSVPYSPPQHQPYPASQPFPGPGFHGALPNQGVPFNNFTSGGPQHRQSGRGRGGDFHRGRGHHHYNDRRRRDEPQDRPKSRHTLPGTEEWVLVKTKLGRRFVYNTEKKQSYWRIPDELKETVEKFDEAEERRKTGEVTPPAEDEGDEAEEEAHNVEGPNHLVSRKKSESQPPDAEQQNEDSDYEMVEVTDDDEEETSAKRQKLDDAAAAPPDPQEFNEDDIAYQLAAMGADYGLDPGEYDAGEDEELEEGAEGLPLTEEGTTAVFRELLDEHGINPYSTWEKIIEEGQIVDDERYTVLPNMRARREVWAAWSTDRIAEMKAQREKEEKKNPLIPYLLFLQTHATPKLYWPEFRRKHKKAPEMRDPALSDKDREKHYREYIARLKLPIQTLKSDLTALLRSLPPSVLNSSSSPASLPTELLTHPHYISAPASTRGPLVEAYISTLAPAPSMTADTAQADEAGDRTRRALQAREEQVRLDKRRQDVRLATERHHLRQEEEELARVTTSRGSKLVELLQPTEVKQEELAPAGE